ncbi:MAG: 30S ribosomal protein S7 [Candidatus Paceibacterota bacterium]|jgi:small subunit ribosomal protein S7
MRKKRKYTKQHEPDVKYDKIVISRFINYLMKDGKKSVAETVLYDAFDIIEKQTKQNPLEVFEKCLDTVSPLQELVSRRVGGANYQVPREVRPERKFFLACKWIIDSAASAKGKPMAQKLAEEIILGSKNEGNAIKKKQTVHRMAEANRAFAHFARPR